MKKKTLNSALDDLDQAFENLEVKPISNEKLGRIAGGTILGCSTSGATCNSKCGDTAYWECGGGTSDLDNTCNGSGCSGPTVLDLNCEWTNTPGFPGCL